MPNTHLIADTMAEIMAREEDLLPACVISTTWPTVPVSSLTLAAFTTQAYARDGQHLVYCDQPAITLTLPATDGTHWVAISRDVSTTYSGWTRRAGSHYLHRVSGTRPADIDGLLVALSCTVAGGVVTAVTPAPGVTRAEAWRALGGLGTMATQNADAVAITGGSITGLTGVTALAVPGCLTADTSTFRTTVPGLFILGSLIGLASHMDVTWDKSSKHAIVLRPGGDGGAFATLLFLNAAGVTVGSITQTASATAYNTSSDVRLKHALATLTGALDVVAALRPVRFRWNADDSPDEGFLAHELQQVLPHAVSGEADAVNEDGTIRPQQVDHSKLVVWLVGAVQELAARVTSLEEQLGV